jgi:hypothetical protein
MKRRTFILLISLLSTTTLTTLRANPPQPTANKAQTKTYTRNVARGVQLIQEIRPERSNSEEAHDGPLVITVLKINPKEKNVRFEAALGQDTVWSDDATFGREIVSKIVKRRGALVGINTGFFPFAGNPIGLHIEKGNLVTEPTLNRSFFGQTPEGIPTIGAFRYQGKVEITMGNAACSYKIAGLNRKPGKGNELLLFTPIFAEKTLPAPDHTEFIVELAEGLPEKITPNTDYTGTVKEITEGGNTSLTPGMVVLSAGGDAVTFLKQHAMQGQPIKIRLDCLPTDANNMISAENLDWAMAGGPRLLRAGKIEIPLEAEGMSAPFSTTRHPRTAMGITQKGEVLLVTVDGRQTGLSRGVSLTEMAQILLKFGAVEGVNMDGGGSTTMSLRGGLLNSPSEGIERPVANMLLVYADDLPLPKPTFTLAATRKTMLVGETIKLVTAEQKNGQWTANGGTGFMAQDGTFRALRPGKATVRFSWGSKESESMQTEITILEAKK